MTGAQAATGSVSTTGAKMYYNVHTVTGSIDYTITDTVCDGYCARGYVATYNGVLWNSWVYLGQACGVGKSNTGSKGLDSGYIHGTRVKVCRGTSQGKSLTCSAAHVTS